MNTSYTDGLYVNEGQANSINSSMIQNGQVNNADLANTAVTTAKISGSGGVANDVLTYDGQNVVWQAVPADQDWTISGGNVYRASGSVGIGTTSPAARTHIKGAGTGTSQALLVTNSANAVNLTLFDNGNLGLGDQGPDAILEIV
ncbi:MAG: hypothetical protein GWO08_02585, partial [Gammaproteobacteria bacterium]|nr:hypothetical protein [Gammaproteobacteria bacterium]NIX57462.1 hypothetical protein [candidate division Zixibacteria bacterium]